MQPSLVLPPRRRVTFAAWIGDYGPQNVSRELGVSRAVVRAWRRYAAGEPCDAITVYPPSVLQAKALVRISHGRLTLDAVFTVPAPRVV